MKKNALKFVVLSFFAFCLTLNLAAQDLSRADKSNRTDEEKLEKRMERLNRIADKLEMTDVQRDQFIPAQLEFGETLRTIRKSGLEEADRKEQVKALSTEHRDNLATFLSPEQMTKIEKRLMKIRDKRKGNKEGKRGKRGKRGASE